jgi:hypothetical protein
VGDVPVLKSREVRWAAGPNSALHRAAENEPVFRVSAEGHLIPIRDEAGRSLH